MSMLVSAIALNAIPNIDLAVAICSSTDAIMSHISTTSRSAIRVFVDLSCARDGGSADLLDDWVKVDAPGAEMGIEPGCA